MNRIFALDVGGTEIKAGIVSLESDGMVREIGTYPSCSQDSKDVILNNFKLILKQLADKEQEPDGIALAFPGDFDYQNGICLMKNVGKYDSIFGLSIRDELYKLYDDRELRALKGKPIYFLNDVSAFAIGTSMDIDTVTSERILCVCIGTGCGSAFLVNGKLVGDEVCGVPKNGWIYSLPFNDSIIDDYLSKRGLVSITHSTFGMPIEGLELSKLAKDGNVKAACCFSQFGENIVEALTPIAKSFNPHRIILGGQIAKSYELFGKSLSHMCDSKGITLDIITQTSSYALKGLSVLFNN